MRLIFALVLCGCFYTFNAKAIQEEDKLIGLGILFRHGDRTITKSYPTDPYADENLWPAGFGQLISKGKERQYELGQWIRKRYDGFLPAKYSEKDLYVSSTNEDRTLMSAAANLAGLYPPVGNQIWNKNIPWQPIPIHTFKNSEDILFGKKDCQNYNRLYKQLQNSDKIRNIKNQNADLFEYINKNSGLNIDTLQKLKSFHSTLYVEEQVNFTVPEWTKKVYPQLTLPLAELAFQMAAYTPEMQKYKVGSMYSYLIKNFKKLSDSKPTQKFFVLSGHDGNIANMLQSMNAFKPHLPNYASAIIFELKKDSAGNSYVNIFYKPDDNLIKININVKDKTCAFNCYLENFEDILKPIILEEENFTTECTRMEDKVEITGANVIFM